MMDLKLFSGITFSMADIQAMFGLQTTELNLNILHAQAGASLFTATMHQKNLCATACDPLYDKSPAEINNTLTQAIDLFEQNINSHPYQYAQEDFARQLVEYSKKNLAYFLADAELGLPQNRYYAASLDNLPFKNEQFELALVSHYLFSHTDELSLEFHVKAIAELTRVANEVRIFPLVTEKSALSPYLGKVIAQLQSMGLNEEIRIVNFELQKKGNAMLRVWSNSCSLAAHQG